MDLKTLKQTIINDPFGIYPIYKGNKTEDFILSNDFFGLCTLLKNIHFDLKGITDYFLFNYTLQSRTLIKEIDQLRGGSKLTFSENELLIKKAFDVGTILNKSREQEEIPMHELFRNNLLGNLNENLPIELALTGGFDNKVSLSVLLESKKKFKAFTFGNKNNPDQIAAHEVAQLFNIPHEQLPINDEFLHNLDTYVSTFIRNAGNAPVIDSLIYYQMVNQKIQKSNMVLGHMGGELIVGPVLISELVITKNCALILNSTNKNELSASLEKSLKEINLLNFSNLKPEFENYVSNLTEYSNLDNTNKNKALLQFLIQETYSKFFGTVFTNLFGRYNVINPYLDLNFLQKLYASPFSFLKKKSFKKSPVGHFFSRRLYPILIKNIYPKVLKSKMDRGYILSDFLKWYKFYKPVLNYSKRHLFKKKKAVSLTHDLNHLMIRQFSPKWEHSKLRKQGFINEKEIDQILKKHQETKDITKTEEKNLLKLIALNYLLESSDINIVGAK